MRKKIKNLSRPKLKLVWGTRLTSFLFVATSIAIAAGILFAANMYYNIDTGEVVTEEIQRITGVLRATAGAIVGGTATQNPSSGYVFEVAGKTKLATTTVAEGVLELTAADQVLRFSGGTSYYIGFKSPTNTTSTKTYILPQHGQSPPSADYVLTWQTGDQLQWKEVTAVGGVGDITAVGDVASGAAFTQTGTQGTSLWFYDAQGRGQLTIADLTAARTYTLPDLTGTITLASGGLGTGGVLFANAGLIATSTNLVWDNTQNRLGIGTNSPAYLLDVKGDIRSGGPNATGTIRIMSGTTNTQVVLRPSNAMTATTTYILPPNVGANNYVLTTDGTGVLTWKSVVGAGGVDVYGTPSQGQVSIFYDANTILGDSGLTYSTTTQKLTLTGGLVTNLLQYTGGNLTIQTLTSGDIILDPASGIVQLGSNDYLKTSGGFEIGKAGTQVMRGAVSIFGFDLPMRCKTSCSAGTYATTTRIIENVSGLFPDAYSGTTRKYRFAIRYADATTTAYTTWQVATSSDPTYVSQFTLPPTSSTDLGKGFATTTNVVSLPSSGNWFLRVTTGQNGNYELQVYDILLIGLDEIQ